GASGLDFYKSIINDAADCLKKEGVLMFEIGHDQKDEVCALLEETGKFENILGLQDLAKRDRIIFATLASKKK
ncbi:MAG: protein-(glutamine-N5) methyltransferase, release factor-specific, partial [Firmicutes bacterium]|nr:protein-(glutamine-N5) methyltransferase, release factor-specific [Bacillota bacterium]